MECHVSISPFSEVPSDSISDNTNVLRIVHPCASMCIHVHQRSSLPLDNFSSVNDNQVS